MQGKPFASATIKTGVCSVLTRIACHSLGWLCDCSGPAGGKKVDTPELVNHVSAQVAGRQLGPNISGMRNGGLIFSTSPDYCRGIHFLDDRISPVNCRDQQNHQINGSLAPTLKAGPLRMRYESRTGRSDTMTGELNK